MENLIRTIDSARFSTCHVTIMIKTRISASGLQVINWRNVCDVQTVTTKVYMDHVYNKSPLYIPSMDSNCRSVTSSNTPDRNSAIVSIMKNGCIFKTVNNAAQGSIDQYQEIVDAKSICDVIAGRPRPMPANFVFSSPTPRIKSAVSNDYISKYAQVSL
jgi:hypothetical protein